MFGEGVLVILSNYRRPQNLPACIAAWRGQSVLPAKIVVVDNSPVKDFGNKEPPLGWFNGTQPREIYPDMEFLGAHDVWRFTTNSGCPCKLAPAMLLYGHRYVLFADDDLLPGSRAIEHAMEAATALQDRFSTLGFINRRFRMDLPPGERYSGRCTVAASDRPMPCDLTCQVHLVRADMVHCAVVLRNNLLARSRDNPDIPALVGIHDDFLLCMGVQRATSWPSYVLPASDDSERWLVRTRLDEQGSAVWRRPDHFAERERMVELSLAAGWRSLA